MAGRREFQPLILCFSPPGHNSKSSSQKAQSHLALNAFQGSGAKDQSTISVARGSTEIYVQSTTEFMEKLLQF